MRRLIIYAVHSNSLITTLRYFGASHRCHPLMCSNNGKVPPVLIPELVPCQFIFSASFNNLLRSMCLLGPLYQAAIPYSKYSHQLPRQGLTAVRCLQYLCSHVTISDFLLLTRLKMPIPVIVSLLHKFIPLLTLKP